tara:strand:- start:541 stop:951 length:411 start_codon:yes stop_codon:yes gene_type:complete
MSSKINISVSVGELVDKITILEIKSIKITDNKKLKYINEELRILQQILESSNVKVPDKLYNDLRKINLKLWDAEDIIRECEQKQDFSTDFIKCARLDAHLNDQRFLVKDKINEACNSLVREQKSYSDEVFKVKVKD